MSITKSTIRRLEKRILPQSGYVVIPILSSSEEAEAIRQEAARQGKSVIGVSIEGAEKNNIKLWTLKDLQEAGKEL